MGRKGFAIVHGVDMITRENKHILRLVTLDDVEALEHGVGRAQVPGFIVEPLLRRNDVNKLALFRAQPAPTPHEMLDEGMRLVLRENADAADAGIEAVGKGEIDNPELATERHCRLGPPIGERSEAAAAPAGQYERQRVVREAADETFRGFRHRSIKSRAEVPGRN